MFQSDNGKEFVKSIIEKLLHSWSIDRYTDNTRTPMPFSKSGGN